MTGYPLDLQSVSYSYLERPNRSVLRLLERHVLQPNPAATILDVGCGCGANARAIRQTHRDVRIVGVEPDPRAAELARDSCNEVFNGTLEQWLASSEAARDAANRVDSVAARVDAIVLSDVLEHIADPVAWLRSMIFREELRNAMWVVSVPNYAVWYNRMRTLFGRFEYAWSGLYDRTHLRFYTKRSIRELLEYCGMECLDVRGTASLVQSAAPLLRRNFQTNVSAGDHLALMNSPSFRLYQRLVEPAEEAVCNLWKGLLAFQIVTVARVRR
jgi:2-polyprenyl-3-methyl-5-hydroxy-6-metoxy-1,4-benzoquinol methylase